MARFMLTLCWPPFKMTLGLAVMKAQLTDLSPRIGGRIHAHLCQGWCVVYRSQAVSSMRGVSLRTEPPPLRNHACHAVTQCSFS